MRRSLVGLASLTVVVGVGMTASSGASAGPCSPSTPQYCPPPHVHTGPAKRVTSTSATLTGTVNPNGSATTCHFEYGRTKRYGSTTPAQHVGSGTKNEQVSATITGLTPNTVYHYQLVCTNLGGTGLGGDKKFKTHGLPKKPPAVRTNRTRGKGIRSTSAILVGTVNPQGSRTTCWFQYGTTRRYGSTTRKQVVGSGTKSRHVRAAIRGLKSKTVYHDQLVCHSLAGTRRGGDRRFETRNEISFGGSPTIPVSRKGKLSVALQCNGNHQCVGFLSLTGRSGTELAPRVRYTIPSHTTGHIKLTLTSAALAQLGRRHHLSGRLRAVDKDHSSASRKVRLRKG